MLLYILISNILAFSKLPIKKGFVLSPVNDMNQEIIMTPISGLIVPNNSFPPPAFGPDVGRFIKAPGGYMIAYGPMMMCVLKPDSNILPCKPDQIVAMGIWQIETTAAGSKFMNKGFCLSRGDAIGENKAFTLVTKKCKDDPNQFFYIREIPDEPFEFSDYQEASMMGGMNHLTSNLDGEKREVMHHRESEATFTDRIKLKNESVFTESDKIREFK